MAKQYGSKRGRDFGVIPLARSPKMSAEPRERARLYLYLLLLLLACICIRENWIDDNLSCGTRSHNSFAARADKKGSVPVEKI